MRDRLNRGQRCRLFLDYLNWLAYYKPRGRTFQISFANGMKSVVYPDSDSGVSSIYTRNVDYHDFAFIRRVVRKGDFIIDAGCNVGNRTLMLADVIGGALLIEANAECLVRLKRNFELNNLDMSRFHIVCKAVGSRTGTAEFTDIGGTSTLNRILGEEDRSRFPIRTVEMTAIDDEMSIIGNPPCAFMKTDLEGYDLEALKGAVRTLRAGKTRLVRFERWQGVPLQLFVNFFDGLGWSIFALDGGGRPTADTHVIGSARNLFAMPSDVAVHYLRHPSRASVH